MECGGSLRKVGGSFGRFVVSGEFPVVTRVPLQALRDPELEPEAIRSALAMIHPAFRASAQYEHDGLSERAGVPVVVKVETVNPIRAFKGRGTWLAIEGLVAQGTIGPERPVVAASTGNFGQGVAFAARAFGVPAIVF